MWTKEEIEAALPLVLERRGQFGGLAWDESPHRFRGDGGESILSQEAGFGFYCDRHYSTRVSNLTIMKCNPRRLPIEMQGPCEICEGREKAVVLYR